MSTSAKKYQALILLLFLVVTLIQTSLADSTNSIAEEKLPEFVWDVVGLDMTKYNITDESYGFSYPSEYGCVAKEESVSFKLVSERGTIYTASAHAIFLNGFIPLLTVDVPTNAHLFFVDSPTDAIDESRNILERYKVFAEEYGFDTSHIDHALMLLDNATGESSADADFHLLNDIIGFVPSVTTEGNMRQETDYDSITWTYTEQGVNMPNRCLKIDFGGNRLHFVDTWNLFTVGCFSVISEDEAIRIGWDTAKNYNVTLIGEDGPYTPEFEWSNRTYVKLNMIPGQIHNITAEDNDVDSGNATRDPLALYPQWFLAFYFDKPIPTGNRCIVGVVVSVWGDTKEIASTGITQSSDFTKEHPYLTNETSLEVPEENTTESENSDPFSDAYLIGGIAAVAAIAVVVAAVAFKKRKNAE